MSEVNKIKGDMGGEVSDRPVDYHETRRKLLKIGVAGSVVAVTSVTSRSVFATGTWRPREKACTTTPSAFGSINLSRPDVNICGWGRSPGYWKQEHHFDRWPSGVYPTTVSGSGGHSATKFSDKFGPATGALQTATFLQVLSPEMGVVNNPVARALACAYLNAAAGKTTGILTITQVTTIWSEYATKGYYEPTAGIKWYAETTDPVAMSNPLGSGIIGYLETTWT